MSSTLIAGQCNSSSALMASSASSSMARTTARPHRPQRERRRAPGPHTPSLPVPFDQFEGACRKLFNRLISLRPGSSLDVRSWGFSLANQGERPIPIEALLMGWGSISKTDIQRTFEAYNLPPPFVAAQMFWLQQDAFLVNLADDSVSASLNIVLQSQPPRPGQLHHAGRVHHGNVIPQDIDQQMIDFYAPHRIHIPSTRVVVQAAPAQAVPAAEEFPAFSVPPMSAAAASGQTEYAIMATHPAAPGTEERNRAFELQRAFRQAVFPEETIRDFHQMTVEMLVTKAQAGVQKMLEEAEKNATLRFSQAEQLLHSGSDSVNIQEMIYGFQSGPNFEQRQQYWVALGLENPYVAAQREVFKSTKHFLRNFSDYTKKAGLFVVVHSLCPRGDAKMWHGQDICPSDLISTTSARSERFVVPKFDRAAVSFPALRSAVVALAAAAAAPAPAEEAGSAWGWDEPSQTTISYASISSRPAAVPDSWDAEDAEDAEDDEDDWEKVAFGPLVKKPRAVTRDETDAELELRVQFEIDAQFEERHAELLAQRKQATHDLGMAKRAIKRSDVSIESKTKAVADAQTALSALEKERVAARRAAIAEAKLAPRRKIVISGEDDYRTSAPAIPKIAVPEETASAPAADARATTEPTKVTRADLWAAQMRNLSHYTSFL